MKHDQRQVFGISPVPPDNHRPFAFVKVIAEVIDGQLVVPRNARQEFPTEGNVYVEERFWALEGVGAVWRVQHTRTAAEGERQAEYSAIGRGQVHPYEIISIAQRSDAPDAVREQLLQGQDLGYAPASTILVRLGDNAVLGPVRCEPLESNDGFGYRCRADAFNEPLGFWQDISALNPVSFLDDERVARQFAANVTLPAPESYFDCAPLEHAIRGALKAVRENDTIRQEINKRSLDTLARELSAVSPSSKISRRVARVIESLADREFSEKSLDALREHLASAPVVQQELAVLREQARADAKAGLLGEQKQLTSSVKELTVAHARLSKELADLQDRHSRVETDIAQTVDRVAEKIRGRITEVIQDPTSLLSEVALIRPFLPTAPSTPTAATAARETSLEPSEGVLSLRRLDEKSAATDVDTRSTLLGNLEKNLTAAGLSSVSAKRVTREILASAMAGQLVTFSGSIANEVARAVATTFAAGFAYEYRVPVGLLDGTNLANQFALLLTECQTAGVVGVLVIEGLNRSATEAYLQEIQKYVVTNQLAGGTEQPVVVVASLSRGPSALPWSAPHCEYGPLIDTDSLTLGTKPPPPPQPGRLPLALWNDWRRSGQHRDRRIELDESIVRAIEGEPSLLWRRVTGNAWAQLSVIEGQGALTVLQSMAFGWLVPRARACEVPAGQFLAELRAATTTPDGADPRLTRLLERLYSEEPTT